MTKIVNYITDFLVISLIIRYSDEIFTSDTMTEALSYVFIFNYLLWEVITN